jgi:phospholipase C
MAKGGLEQRRQVRHIVVVIMQNRSLDHMLR